MANKQLYGQILNKLCTASSLPLPEPEYVFAKPRRWRFDFAWPQEMVAVEIEGGVWVRGRHTRPAGYLADMEKYNTAVLLGWKVLRYSPDQLGTAVTDLKKLL